ncbi:HEAT repeat domain-containing protein [Nitriliruptor alkaliphilus]|uniref:HEAT repeat domain-containing protein n=1 Tax=Nitriliruptor alkaliphilus TaxID=427918 RepID=UPI00146FF392|nr:HEAT repeat domain-containing protein [Nitriliruptor alkaliphilus]
MRDGEQRLVGWAALLFAVTQAGHGLGANTADTLFFLRFGVEFLPVMILVSGPVVMLATLVHSAGLGRVGVSRWLVVVLWALAGWVVLERIGVAVGLPGIYAVVWLGGQVAILVSFTVMWNAAAEVCTTRQAKRLFPLFASAGIGGGIVGNALTGPLAALLGTENLLLVHAALLAGGAVVMDRLVRCFVTPASDNDATGSGLADLRAGLAVTLRTPLLRLAAGVAVAFSVLFFLVVFPFAEVVTASFDSEAEVAGYLGLFSAIATALTFVVSLFGANRLFARIGVVATLLVVPIVYAAGFGLWIVAFGLVTATLVRGAQWVALNGLGATAWSSLFNVLPTRRRGQVLASIAGVPTQLGTTIAGVLLIVGSRLPPEQQAVIGLGVALVAVVLVARMRRAYAGALVDAVRQGLVEVFSAPTPGIQKPTLDADAHAALLRALEDPDPRSRAVAASMLGRLEPSSSADGVARALRDGDARVRVAALDGLADDPASIEMAQSMLGDESSEIRRRAIAVLERHAGDLGPLADRALTDPDPTVRAGAASLVDAAVAGPVIAAMLRSDDPRRIAAALPVAARCRIPVRGADPESFADHPDRRVRLAAAQASAGRADRVDTLRRLLDDPSVRVRTAAADALAAHAEAVPTLLEVLDTGSVRACDAALRALVGAGIELDGLRSWVATEIDRAAFLRRHAITLQAAASGSTHGYLARLLRARQERLQRWALLALDSPAIRGAMPVVRRGIWSSDPETRAQALEALDSLTDRSLARSLIPLLEDDVRVDHHDIRSTLRELSEDLDAWIRALALRSLAEDLTADLEQLQRAAGTDPCDLVRSAVARWRPTQMDEIRILDIVDRVVALQQVPMFAEIDAEDLERVASVTTERRYEPDEPIFRYGTVGDEMLVVITGEVDVHRSDGAVIRSYGAGQHVGELALLSGRPRAADVIAGPDGVHGLLLGAVELEAILEERPEVAIAMLATLAERLATM